MNSALEFIRNVVSKHWCLALQIPHLYEAASANIGQLLQFFPQHFGFFVPLQTMVEALDLYCCIIQFLLVYFLDGLLKLFYILWVSYLLFHFLYPPYCQTLPEGCLQFQYSLLLLDVFSLQYLGKKEVLDLDYLIRMDENGLINDGFLNKVP